MKGEIFFGLVLALSGVLLSVLLGKGQRLWRRTPASEWDRLLGSLAAISWGDLPRSTLDPAQDPAEDEAGELESGMEPSQADNPCQAMEPDLWAVVGGLRGLQQMEANCEILIALACEVQQRYPEALVVAERLRLDARQIQWHVERLKGAERLGKLLDAFPDYAERAVGTYEGMTARLLALYEVADATRYAELKRVL